MKASQVIRIDFDRQQLLELYQDAEAAAMGGRSQVRTDDRQDELLTDQFVGLAGNAALSIWKDGDMRAYRDMRHMQNRFPDKGDGGYDLPRCRFDVKASKMRSSRSPLAYNLPVRPHELHAGWVYGLALVEPFTFEGFKDNPRLTVYLVGWCMAEDLPAQPNGAGVFKGAHVLPASALNPFVPLLFDGVAVGVNQVRKAA